MKKLDVKKLKEISRSVRSNIIRMVARVKSSHVGGNLSVVDILSVLYFAVLRIDPKKPDNPDRDRLILSKGHCAAALYAVLAERGFAPLSVLDDYFMDGKLLTGHPTKNCLPGIEVSTGSLGHGLAMGVGMAYAARYDKKKYFTFVIMSDGECDTGSVWESALSASHFKLDNLIAIIDYNKLQGLGRTETVLSLEPLKSKWEAFGWAVKEVNGHNFKEMFKVFNKLPIKKNRPSIIIAHTIKGKGVSFMENKLEWHYKYPQGEEIDMALKEINS